jgi:TonB family protein
MERRVALGWCIALCAGCHIGPKPINHLEPEPVLFEEYNPCAGLETQLRAPPIYPREANTQRVGGWARVTHDVEPTGLPVNSRVVAASPPGLLEESARNTVAAWRFPNTSAASKGCVQLLRFSVMHLRPTRDHCPGFRATRWELLTREPEVIHMPRPEYPKDALAQRAHGVVRLRVELCGDGTVHRVDVMNGVHDSLDNAAAVALMLSRFQPAAMGERPVPVAFRYAYRFELHQ